MDDFNCTCAAGFEGKSCQIDIDDCASPTNQFDCECDIGYSPVGDVCKEDNECDSDPCQNGGTCTDLIDDFNCSCVTGFVGNTCEMDCVQNSGANGKLIISIHNYIICTYSKSL